MPSEALGPRRAPGLGRSIFIRRPVEAGAESHWSGEPLGAERSLEHAADLLDEVAHADWSPVPGQVLSQVREVVGPQVRDDTALTESRDDEFGRVVVVLCLRYIFGPETPHFAGTPYDCHFGNPKI